MIDAPLALAFTAGLVATVNPCGFAMLPAYLSYFMGLRDEAPQGPAAVGRGLAVGGVVSAGFLLVFAVAGTLVTLGIRSVIDYIPWAALVIGGLLAILGVAMLAGFEPMVNLPKLGERSQGRGFGSVFVFGVSYAIASLSCTLPVFLAIVAGVIPRTNLVSGILTFVVYGLGMSLVLLAVTVGLALGRRSLVRLLRASARYMNRVAGAILVVAGSYIVYFWTLNISQGPGGLTDPVRIVDRLSAALTNLIGNRPALWGLAFGVVVLAAGTYVLLHRKATPPSSTQGHLERAPAEDRA
jgi:cytochrome c biogenesis protein CcdA